MKLPERKEDRPHCSYCGADTHCREDCPWEPFDKMEPEYERLKAECIKAKDCMRYGLYYKIPKK